MFRVVWIGVGEETIIYIYIYMVVFGRRFCESVLIC